MTSAEQTKTTTGLLSAVSTAVTLTAAVAGSIGVSAGVLTTLLRNHPVQTGVALLLATAGAATALIAAITQPEQSRTKVSLVQPRTNEERGAWAILGALVFVAAICWLGYLYVGSLRTTERPIVTASYSGAATDKGPATLKLEAKANGLNRGERFFIRVDALSEDFKSIDKVFYSWVGPNSEGTLAYSVEVPIGTLNSKAAWLGASARLEDEDQDTDKPISSCGFAVPVPLETPNSVAGSPPSETNAAGDPEPSLDPSNETPPPGASGRPPARPASGTTCAVIKLPALPPATAPATPGS